jgi:hypothetical protein
MDNRTRRNSVAMPFSHLTGMVQHDVYCVEVNKTLVSPHEPLSAEKNVENHGQMPTEQSAKRMQWSGECKGMDTGMTGLEITWMTTRKG